MKAILKNYRQSPRKVRLVTDLVRGKSVAHALSTLSFLEKRAALPILKLLKSALANARAAGTTAENLVIKRIVVDKGEVSKRYMPRARGSASPINRRTSHVIVELSEQK